MLVPVKSFAKTSSSPHSQHNRWDSSFQMKIYPIWPPVFPALHPLHVHLSYPANIPDAEELMRLNEELEAALLEADRLALRQFHVSMIHCY